jgi:glutaconate CoA-transferase, subunit A
VRSNHLLAEAEKKEVLLIDKRLSLQEAVATYVQDEQSVAIEGFTSFICFAAGHEIIRQRRRNLTLIRMTPDVIYDQMVAAGVARAPG